MCKRCMRNACSRARMHCCVHGGMQLPGPLSTERIWRKLCGGPEHAMQHAQMWQGSTRPLLPAHAQHAFCSAEKFLMSMSNQLRPSLCTKAWLQVSHIRMHALAAPAQMHHSMTSMQERFHLASAAHCHAAGIHGSVTDAWYARFRAVRNTHHKQSRCRCACLRTTKGPIAVTSRRPPA